MTKLQNVLIIGSGGREHALSWKMAQSPQVAKVYVAPGNGGTAELAENVPIGFTDVPALLKFAQDHHIDLTVIGQEAASEAGLADAFQDAGLTVFGASKAAVMIETSKTFSKDLMAAERIPTAAYRNFTEAEEARAYAQSRPLPVVIKADGLATGKGVIIAGSITEIDSAIDAIMVHRVFGASGNAVVVEDFLIGQETSIHALSDGHRAVLFPPSQDHKQIFDNDKGPNTGGMGAYAPVAWVTPKHLEIINQRIVQAALDGLKARQADFIGCLYPGLMINGDDVNVIEFNARFGDPEAEVYMRLLDGDLYEILKSCALGHLDPASLQWRAGFAVSVVLCSPGYPGDYPRGLPVSGLAEAEAQPDIVLFHAGTQRQGDQLLTSGGRVLNVTATGPTLADARAKAYAAVKLISFDGMQYRTDIGQKSFPS